MQSWTNENADGSKKDARDEAVFDCKVGPIRIHMVTDPYRTDYDREKG